MKIMSRQQTVQAVLGLVAVAAVLSFQNCGGGFKTAPLADAPSGASLLGSESGEVPTPTPSSSAVEGAESALLSAFGALQNAIANGITGAQLQTLINTCETAKAVAAGYGLDVSAFSCAAPSLPEMTPAQALALLNSAYSALQTAINNHVSAEQIQSAVAACNQAKAAALLLGVSAASAVNCSATASIDTAAVNQAAETLTAAYQALQTAINLGLSGGALAGLRSACESAKTIAAGYGVNVSSFNCQL